MQSRNKEEGREMYRKRGQSILEYVIVLTVIVAAIIFAARSFIEPSVRGTLQSASQSIDGAAGRLPR